MGQPSNRFDFIRLVFASVVFVYHLVVLASLDGSGRWEAWLGEAAEVSIQGFFIVSGALVLGSWERSRGLVDYAEKRVRRLYPGYLVVIAVPIVVSLGVSANFGGAARYAAANGVFLNFLAPDLPGLFEGNRFSEVNGALWTLKIEVMFYMVLPVLAVILTRLGRFWWTLIAALIVAGLIWKLALPGLIEGGLGERLARQLPGQMMYFASGMALWKLWDRVQARPILVGVFGAVLLALTVWLPMAQDWRALGMAALIASVAFMPGPKLNAARWGDVSYGVYIIHFPVVQALVAVGVFARLGAVGGSLLAVCLVFGLSFALWWLVERPALRRDSHYRRVSEAN